MTEFSATRAKKLIELEALRGAAAIYVFLHHAHLMPNQGLGRLLYFGQEAVIVFFLLSGFVIFYSSSRQNPDVRTYLIHRIRRIYPIFIASLLLAYGSHAYIAGEWLALNPVQLLGNFAMLQDVAALKQGVWFDTYYGNSPLWSLSYEWWFYMLFIPLGLRRGMGSMDKSATYALITSIVGFAIYQMVPNQLCLIAGYFFIWWTGVELSREYLNTGRLSLAHQRFTLLGLLLMTLLWAAPVVIRAIQGGEIQVGIHPFLQFRHHLAALVFAIAGVCIAQSKFKLPELLLKPFAYLAPISYAIYLLHQPLLELTQQIAGKVPAWQSALIALALLLPLGWLLEVKLQKLVNRLFGKGL